MLRVAPALLLDLMIVHQQTDKDTQKPPAEYPIPSSTPRDRQAALSASVPEEPHHKQPWRVQNADDASCGAMGSSLSAAIAS